MKVFINFPYELYAGNPSYLPALKSDVLQNFDERTNPAFEFCKVRYWLAYRAGKVVGRIAGIINYAAIEKWGCKTMRFGWIDFVDDAAVAQALMRTVEQWAVEEKMDAIHGPMGLTNFDPSGLLVQGFNEPATFAVMYNHPYYATHLEQAGYQKEIDWVEYRLKVPAMVPVRLQKLAEIVARRYDLHMLQARSKKQIMPYATKIFELMNSAYADLFGMLPLTPRQIEYSIRKYFAMVKPEYVALVLDASNELVAFGIAMPSLTKAMQKARGKLFPWGILHILLAFKKHDVADLALVAVRKDMQGKGVNAMVLQHITAAAIKAGVQYAESNPELELNSKVQSQWSFFESRQHKRRRCYIRYLS